VVDSKFYQREKTIGGVKYVAQFCGLSAWLKCADSSRKESDDDESPSIRTYNKVFEYGLVEPKNITVDSFDNLEDLDAVFKFVSNVMRGKFRDKAAEKGAEAKG